MNSRPAELSAEQISQHLRATLAPLKLEVIDESAQHHGHAGANGSGSGTHFRVRISSPLFAPLSRIESHRLVYDALREFMARGLHALAIEIQTPPPSSAAAPAASRAAFLPTTPASSHHL